MSTEALKTHRFRREFAAAEPDAELTKHNDRTTSGVPDTSITLRGRTLWLEFKRRPSGDARPLAELLKAVNRRSEIQMYVLWRLGLASGGRAFYIVFEKGGIAVVRVLSAYHQRFETVCKGTQTQVINTLRTMCA